MKQRIRTLAAACTLVVCIAPAEAALLSRLSGQAYYDTALNITWLTNANLAATNNFGLAGINPDGTMNWPTANEWIAAMNSANYLGVNNWRLPEVNPVNGSSFDYSVSYNGSTDVGYNVSEQGTAYAGSTGSEMAHLYYNTFDSKGYCTPTSVYPSCTEQPDWGLGGGSGPFVEPYFGPYLYWSGTSYGPDPTLDAWYFDFNDGYQGGINESLSLRAWAVHPGDIAVVPVPGAAWMFGSAVAVIVAVRRRTRNRAAA